MVLSSLLLALVVAGGVRAETVTLYGVADTWAATSEPNALGASDFMYLQGGTGGPGYVRFDLSILGKVTVKSATLVLSVHGTVPKPPYRNDNAVSGRFALYGLNSVAGNTPQDWDEATLTSANTGLEIDWTTGKVVVDPGLGTRMDGDVNGITETLTPVSSAALGTTIAVTGDPLAAFIQGRLADNGLVTFILKNDDANAGRGYGICTKEFADAAYHPRLELEVAVDYPVVIADFEDGFDGWGSQDGWRVGVLSLSATGATEGVQAMLVEGNGGWQQMAMVNLKPFAAALSNPGVVIAADVTAFPADMTTPWMQVEMVLNGAAPIGWSGLGGKGVTLDGQPQTLTWALSDAMVEKIAAGAVDLEYFEMVLVSNMDGASVAKFYVDNIRVVGPPPKTIIWVSDNKGFGTVEPNAAAEQGFIDVLTAQGYNVVYKNQGEYVDGTQYWRTLDPNKVAELEAADLVILSRNADSGSYSTAADNEPNQWNAVTTPILSMSAHMSRVGKWGWVNGTATVLGKDGVVTVLDPNHAVFAGVTLDPNSQVLMMSEQWNADWVKDVNTAGNGTVLATRSDGLLSIVTWNAGQVYFDGSLFTAGGPRMLFVAGTGSKNNVAPDIAPDGFYNLTADGEKMFLNAVAYMIEQGK